MYYTRSASKVYVAWIVILIQQLVNVQKVCLFAACKKAMLFQEFFTLIAHKIGLEQYSLINQTKHAVFLIRR